jgi:hypothetical protein
VKESWNGDEVGGGVNVSWFFSGLELRFINCPSITAGRCCCCCCCSRNTHSQ